MNQTGLFDARISSSIGSEKDRRLIYADYVNRVQSAPIVEMSATGSGAISDARFLLSAAAARASMCVRKPAEVPRNSRS
jgi:nucleoside diphosphate kinase